MTPTETAAILRKFAQCLRADKYLWGASLPGVSAEVGAAIDAAVEMIERMGGALESLAIHCDDSDSAMYGTLSTSFVRDTIRIARGEQ